MSEIDMQRNGPSTPSVQLDGSKKAYMAFARKIARGLATGDPQRSCDADRVQDVLLKNGIELGNSAGSIFRGKEWIFKGELRRSTREKNHRRRIKVWHLQ